MTVAPADDPVIAALSRLDQLDRSVVELIYRARRTIRQAADELNTTPQRINAALMRAMREVASAVETKPG